MSEITAAMIKELRERTGVGMSKCKEALALAGGSMDEAIDILRKKGMASSVKKEGRETKEGFVGVSETADTIALVSVHCETDFVANNDEFKKFLEEITAIAVEAKPESVESFNQIALKSDSSITVDQARNLIIQKFGENIQISKLEIISKKENASYGIYAHMGGKIVTVVEISGSDEVKGLAKEIAMHVAAEDPDYLNPEQIPQEIKEKEEEIAKSQITGKPENIIAKIVEGKLKAFYEQNCLLLQKFVKEPSMTVQDYLSKEAQKIGKDLTITRFWRRKI